MDHIVFEKQINHQEQGQACALISSLTGLSKSRIKHAMTCGAVWIQKPGEKNRRLRRATAIVKPGYRIALFYDEDILQTKPNPAKCLKDFSRYSIWFKPAGLMTQGSRFGDHCTLLRQVDKFFLSKRQVFPVHRIDRETHGLLLLAHDREAAAKFSKLFQQHLVKKQYQAIVLGCPAPEGRKKGVIDLPLDGRTALTRYTVLSVDLTLQQSRLCVQTITGRRHQIRRHFDMIGHPLIGDSLYGQGNKNKKGLQLVAWRLSFNCPFGNGLIDIKIDPNQLPI